MRSPRRLAGPIVASAALHLLVLLVVAELDWSFPIPDTPLVVRVIPVQPPATHTARAEPGLAPAGPPDLAQPAPPLDRPPVAQREPAQPTPRRTPAPVATPTPRAAPTPTPPRERPRGQSLARRSRPERRSAACGLRGPAPARQ